MNGYKAIAPNEAGEKRFEAVVDAKTLKLTTLIDYEKNGEVEVGLKAFEKILYTISPANVIRILLECGKLRESGSRIISRLFNFCVFFIKKHEDEIKRAIKIGKPEEFANSEYILRAAKLIPHPQYLNYVDYIPPQAIVRASGTNLRRKCQYSDISVSVSETSPVKFFCHRFVLARSHFFERLFETQANSAELVLPGMEPDQLELILQCLYGVMHEDNLPSSWVFRGNPKDLLGFLYCCLRMQSAQEPPENASYNFLAPIIAILENILKQHILESTDDSLLDILQSYATEFSNDFLSGALLFRLTSFAVQTSLKRFPAAKIGDLFCANLILTAKVAALEQKIEEILKSQQPANMENCDGPAGKKRAREENEDCVEIVKVKKE